MRYFIIALSFIYNLFSYELTPIKTKKYNSTLIKSTIDNSKKAVLYIHGFNDYIFNQELTDKFNKNGFNFFGIEIHNYGRNIDDKTLYPYLFKDIKEFFPEIKKSIFYIKNNYNIQDITIIGHSQGGLLASLFVNKYSDNINRLVLNSPFFNFDMPKWQKIILSPIINFIGYAYPRGSIQFKTSKYGQSIHKDFFGEWDFNTTIKRVTPSPPIHFGWLKAIVKAQNKLQKGLNIKVPVLIMHSDKSYVATKLNLLKDLDVFHSSDVVLNVEDIKKYGKNIGNNVKFLEVENAIHDVFLSKKEIRSKAFEDLLKWIKRISKD